MSTLEIKLRAVIAAQKALAAAADDLIATWSADEPTRNRPDRQRLSGALCDCLPRPLVFGQVIDRIASACTIDLDSVDALAVDEVARNQTSRQSLKDPSPVAFVLGDAPRFEKP